jgi:Zn-dependent peptidase ImmA (M78 family)
MRWDEIKKQADTLVAKLPDGAYPEVPVEIVARQLGLPIIQTDLGDGVSGILVTEGKRSYIGVQKKDHIHRRRFSIAHEIAHYLLNHHRDEPVHVDQEKAITFRAIYRSSDSAGTRKETEANHFAACLLLPEDRVNSEARKISRGKQLTDTQIEELARMFRVSAAAMTIRLQVLRLL